MSKKNLLNLEQYGDALPGEDRSFGGNDFYVEMIPSTAWYANLRAMIPLSQWKALSTYVKSRNHDHCEICGSGKRTEAHERWLFDEITGTQKLMRIMCLCKMCHLSVHIGFSGMIDFRNEVNEHIFSITGWTKADLDKHTEDAKAIWKALSKTFWKQDVSIVESAGFTMYDPEAVRANVDEKKKSSLAQSKKSTIEDEDGCQIDLTRELKEGLVVFLAQTDEERLDGVPLSNWILYVAKHPSKLKENTIQIPLNNFIQAHNNPIVINDIQQLNTALKDHVDPKMLIVDQSLISEKIILNGFKNCILFSFK